MTFYFFLAVMTFCISSSIGAVMVLAGNTERTTITITALSLLVCLGIWLSVELHLS